MYDQVLEAAVIAIPHPKWTERPLLVVVSAEGSKLTKEDMLNFLQVLHATAWCFRSCMCFCSMMWSRNMNSVQPDSHFNV